MASSNVTRLVKPPTYIFLFAGLFIINKCLEILEVKTVEIISSYLDDLLFLPIALWFTRTVIRIFKSEEFNFKIGHYLFIWTYISIMFEFIIPKWKPYFVSDPMDILVYAFGTLLFIFLEKLRLSRK